MDTCYRHPNRETGVSCSNCGNPICTDCMTTTPVGMRCPDCASQKTQVRTIASVRRDPVVTYALIALNVLAFLGMSSSGSGFGGAGGSVFADGALYGPSIENGDYWRLITSGFLHDGLLHLFFNCYILYWLGGMLEPQIGRARFVGLYFASMLAGSFGALLLSFNAATIGASGAVFGLMGAAFVMQRARGIDPMQSGIGVLLLLNLGITFLPGFNISVGGHLGGLIGGALCGWLIDQASDRRLPQPVALVICVLVGAAAVAGSIVVAASQSVG